MYFQSQANKLFWIFFSAFLGVDLLIGILLAWYFDAGIIAVIVYLIFMQVLLPIFYFIRAFVASFAFSPYIKENISKATLADLERYGYPEPEIIESSAIGYFNKIIKSKKIKRKIIASAAFNEGYLKAVDELAGLQGRFILSAYVSGLEDAISDYRKECGKIRKSKGFDA